MNTQFYPIVIEYAKANTPRKFELDGFKIKSMRICLIGPKQRFEFKKIPIP